MLHDGSSGSSDSHHIAYASPIASVSSRSGSRAGSISSQSSVRRSLLLAHKTASDSRLPSPLSASANDKGKGRASPTPTSSISSVSSVEAPSRRVPFGFRNSFEVSSPCIEADDPLTFSQGQPIQTRSRPPSVITSHHSPSSHATSLSGVDAPTSGSLSPLRLVRSFFPKCSFMSDDEMHLLVALI